jgi:hypothetical protein
MIRRAIRERLLDLLGHADEGWYWFYQLALCHLGEDPSKADAMYEQTHQQYEAAAWQSLVERLRNSDAAGPRDTS